jgi:hypothetical protein
MSIAPLSTATNLTLVPTKNLDNLPKEELVRLLKRVADERNDLNSRAAKNPKAAAPDPVFNVAAAKKRIASSAIKAIKKSAHNRQKSPWTEISDSLGNTEAALALFADCIPSSDTARFIKWELNRDDIHNWLGISPIIHPVKFEGKLLGFRGGPKPKIHAWAAYETLQAKFEKNTGHLTLKFHSFMVGAGIPDGSGMPPTIFG